MKPFSFERSPSLYAAGAFVFYQNDHKTPIAPDISWFGSIFYVRTCMSWVGENAGDRSFYLLQLVRAIILVHIIFCGDLRFHPIFYLNSWVTGNF